MTNEIIKKICTVDAEHILDDRGQPPLWPLMVETGAWYLNKCFLYNLYKTLEGLKKLGKSKDKIAVLFKVPSRLSYPLHQIHYSFGELKGDKGTNLLIDLVDFIKFFRKEDTFCETGKNILWSKDEVNNALKTYNLLYLNNDDEESNRTRKIIGKLNTVLWLYTELITVGHHSICHEFHGPYKINKNQCLIVREYYDLKNPKIWPFSEKMPANKIVTMEIYEDIIIKFDFFNHTESTSELPSHLKAFLIGIENFEKSVNSYKDIVNILEASIECLSSGNEYILSFKEVDWITKLMDVYYWCLKPHKDILGKDWKPKKQVNKFIKIEKPDKEFNDLMDKVGLIKSGAVSHDDARKMLVDHYLKNIGVIKDF